jgi:prepilin-type N-terminal cleavage/methylation domain-containing protein
MASRKRHFNQRGFTLLEAAVVVSVFGLIMMGTFQLFSRLGVLGLRNEQVGRSQAGARIAMDELKSALRSAGAEVDLVNGQSAFVHADPFTVAFNSNLAPAEDPDGTGAPTAIRVGMANSGVPSDGAAFYTPNRDYDTGAETLVFTLDSNLDGLVTAADKGDDPEEQSTNPNDYVLYRNTYGFDGNANSVDRSPVAVLRGPELATAEDYVPPLFSYWLDSDDDRSTPPVLYGDANGNGQIDAAESAGLTALSPRDMARIERVLITVTSETAGTDGDVHDAHGGYDRVSLVGEVSVRQRPRSTATIYGTVYKDLNGNGSRDANEPTLAGVTIRSNTGMTATTGANGTYVLSVNPASITVTENDPTGYSSTTPNSGSVDAYAGSYHRFDFGDVPSSGMAVVTGEVYADVNANAVRDQGERGIANVRIYSDTGEYTQTDDSGQYRLDVPVGNRAISEVDSTGYLSTTPNTVDLALTSPGMERQANFGDRIVAATGTIEGYVFDDTDRDGVRGHREGGVAGAIIVVDVSSTESDVSGFFSLTVPVGRYDVTEQDPPGYTSTTPNTLRHIDVLEDQVTTVAFGDIVQEDITFDVIELANTERALSIVAVDLGEDNRGDKDLVLGTRYSGGVNNLLVWHNNRRNSNTPNAAIFDNTPTYSRPNVADVTNLITQNVGGSSAEDVIAGMGNPLGTDVNVWMPVSGYLPDVPDTELMGQAVNVVWDMQTVDYNRDGIQDLVLAEETGSGQGQIEFWEGTGGGQYALDTGRTIREGGAGDGGLIGAVKSLDMADINGDGLPDLVAGSTEPTGQHAVHVFVDNGMGSMDPIQRFRVRGEISQLRLIDMVEDDANDLDIVVAVQTSDSTGGVELWLGNENGRFGLMTEAGLIQDDWMDTGGAPLSMVITHLDNDVFPDVITGVRYGYGFDGTVEYARSFGHLPSVTTPTTTTSIGAVITMDEGDFNMDGVPDLAAGTQNTTSSGKVFIFFRQ